MFHSDIILHALVKGICNVVIYISGGGVESGARYRQRRHGHSGPPTGNFQLYGDDRTDSNSSDEEHGTDRAETRRYSNKKWKKNKFNMIIKIVLIALFSGGNSEVLHVQLYRYILFKRGLQ